MKKILLIITSFFILNSANARINPSTYELSYKDSYIELSGNFFRLPIYIIPNKNNFQLGNKTPVDSFRNIYSSFINKNYKWFQNNSIGSKKDQKNTFNFYTNLLKNDKLLLKGYAYFKNYGLLFLETRHSKKRFIFSLKKDKFNFIACLNFKQKYPSVFKTVNNSYKGLGVFKIINEKN